MSQANVQEHDVDLQTLLKALEDADSAATILSGCEAGRGHVLRIKRRKLALIFVPGIMASRLMRAGKMIWDPDNILFMLKNFFNKGPAARQTLLVPEGRHPPLLGDKKQRGKVPESFPYALERGWHTVSWTYYGDLLQGLENWDTPLKALVDMPVYAFGYDWMASNAMAGKKLRNFITTLDAEKIIIVSHSMGGLTTRACVNMLGDKTRVLGVIHGAQPAMGAPAAYRRQKAGFEGHSIIDSIASLVVGKDGPNVRALFPFGAGPLELLPCCGYRDLHGDGAWFFYDEFVNGEIVTRSIAPEEIYDRVYTQFDDDCYYGMLSRDSAREQAAYQRVLRGLTYPKKPEKYDDPDELTIEKIFKADGFHKQIISIEKIHPRTLQIFSVGKPTSCTIHWKAVDLTDTILATRFAPRPGPPDVCAADKNIRKIVPGPIDKGNDYFELRWIEKGDRVGDCIITSRREDLVSGETIKEKILSSGRRVALFTLTGKTQGESSGHWRNDGDGTVPLASVIALPTSGEGWGPLQEYLPTYYGYRQNRAAAKQVNNVEHSLFFEAFAIEATQKAIHNLCLAWLKGEIT